MNRPLLGLLLLLTMALVGFHAARFFLSAPTTDPAPRMDERVWIELPVNGMLLKTELALTDEERQQGLSGRESMRDDEGMLFVFPEAGIYSFWMKDMRFAIDMIWLRNGTVVEIAPHMPPPAFGAFPSTHTPKAEADMVLELTAGGAERYGLEVGRNVFAPELIP